MLKKNSIADYRQDYWKLLEEESIENWKILEERSIMDCIQYY